MHIRKYDFDYGRRKLMEKTLKGAGYAGVLGSVWPMITKADSPDIAKAYPDELTSIEAQTKGKIKPGDVITAANVEHVEHLLTPIQAWEIKHDGRRIDIGESTSDISELFEAPYLEASLKNQGRAILDDNLNLWDRKTGVPAKGGLAFTEPKTAAEAQANINFSWGRHNYSQYAVRDWDVGSDGKVQYQYDIVWSELQVTARPDWTIWHGQENKLRYQSVFFTSPAQQAGTSFLNTWHYDQNKFPELIGYLPAFKRVREYPANQRFEPLVPGITVYLSAAWAAGDPMGTWGNYRIVGRQPMLGAVRQNWWPDRPNWEPPHHGGPKGNTYFDTRFELVPEALIIELEPTSYARAPVGKRRTWLDVRNGMAIACIDYDRKGDAWKSFDGAYSKYPGMKTANGDVPWSWVCAMGHDVQANRMSRLYQAQEVTGGYRSEWNTSGEVAYNKYLTAQALRRLGA